MTYYSTSSFRIGDCIGYCRRGGAKGSIVLVVVFSDYEIDEYYELPFLATTDIPIGFPVCFGGNGTIYHKNSSGG